MKLRFYVKIPYFSNHFFKHCAHSVVVQCRLNYIAFGITNRTVRQIHGGIRKLANQQTQNVMLRELVDLIAEFKALDNILYILRKTVQVKNKVRFQLLLIGAGFQI